MQLSATWGQLWSSYPEGASPAADPTLTPGASDGAAPTGSSDVRRGQGADATAKSAAAIAPLADADGTSGTGEDDWTEPGEFRASANTVEVIQELIVANQVLIARLRIENAALEDLLQAYPDRHPPNPKWKKLLGTIYSSGRSWRSREIQQLCAEFGVSVWLVCDSGRFVSISR